MKNVVIMIFLMLLTSLTAYENSFLNLHNPTNLEKGQGEISIKHRFYGDVTENTLDTFFGMNAGANFSLDTRYQLFPKLEMNLHYTRVKKEYQIGSSYKLEKNDIPVMAQVDITYFNFKEPNMNDDTRANFHYLLSVQNDPWLDLLAGNVNIGYDAYYERMNLGLGVLCKITEKTSLIAEYIPVLDRNTSNLKLKRYIGPDDVMNFGIKLDTYGHHFKFMISNGKDMSIHRSSLGTDSSTGWKLGFNLERRMEF